MKNGEIPEKILMMGKMDIGTHSEEQIRHYANQIAALYCGTTEVVYECGTHHNGRFYIDEDSLRIEAESYVQYALTWCRENSRNF